MTTETTNNGGITEEEQNVIKNNHVPSLKGIIQILIKRGTFKKWPVFISLALSIIVCVFVLFRAEKSFFILQYLVEIVQSIFPSLLGFSLGGYAIAVGFGNTELLKNRAKKDKYSLYQTLSAIFSLSILTQVIVTIFGFFVAWIIKVDVVNLFGLNIPKLASFINISILFIIIFLVSYSLLLMPFVVFNLFSLSQVNNLYLTLEKFKEKK